MKSKLYSLPAYEQDTVIQFSRDSNEATIVTSDRTVITKLEKIRAESDAYTLLEIYHIDGLECSRRYKVNDKSLISFRKRKAKRELTEEQKVELAERMHHARSKRSADN